ncbi:SDR family NAD(P)-dependent oxidoreductase [Streptomyces caatingaensis]|uniref:Short-chain dehydrogenase n=1 Tax=Streptomyces caatingaensis TaxID=1678637 RepID=A0A0K9X916_9ACTN|nr:SDR family NAD(P)-dependent oxidoreductase [Streptomyces caatingaensis]KNB49930.1 short-chain dehydrogenase [Streptomyces caatingaensis]
MDQGLRGKRVLVTGGTKGIGRVTALAFADAGARVVVCHRADDEAAASLPRELKEREARGRGPEGRGPEGLGGGHRVVRADVTVRADVERLADVVRAAAGGLDVLVNNVGVDGGAPFAEITDAEWHRLVDHNLTAPYLVTQAVLGLLADGASVVNVGSAAALRGRAGGTHYTATKAALIGFTRGLCKELGPRGIRVNTVAPGLTETEPGAGPPPHVLGRIVGMTALGRLCRPEDVAGAVLFLAGDTSRFVSGVTLNVDGGV